MPDTLTVADGTEVTVEHVDTLASGGARFDFSIASRRWRVDITRDGDAEVVTTWEDGQLADLEKPDWMDDVIARLQPRG